MKISGWGKFPFIEANVSSPNTFDDLLRDVKKGASIARGNGRSYGDSSINIENTIDMKKLNRIISFDPSTGQLTSQSGILLADIIKIFLPKGWFPLVTPGSKYVTLGGMVAADVHGKNHHKDGSFRNCVVWIDLMLSTGEIKRCSRSENKDLFNWTIGGMGLTGIIINVSIKLKSVSTKWIKQKTISTNDFDETMEKIELSLNSTYSVAWIDCLATEKKYTKIKILDKISSKNISLELTNGENFNYDDLQIKSIKCKNSEFDDDPEIIAYVQVKDLSNKNNDEVYVFNGWMFSSSPSINPFDHPVYDIWLTDCN